MWTLICVCKSRESLKFFVHREHANDFSPVWTLKCLCKSSDLPKILVQKKHANGFSPVWAFKCLCKLDGWENDFVHWGQVWGFSPVWTLKCLCKWSDLPKLLVQKEHANGFSPVWTLSRASTASYSLSRVWKIPICSSCFSTQSESGSFRAFASSSTESRGGITSAATLPTLASHLETK